MFRKFPYVMLVSAIIFFSVVFAPTVFADYPEGTKSGTGTVIVSAGQVHLLLTMVPNQATYTKGRSVTISVNVFNKLNTRLDSTLSLTVTGPNNYYYLDFEPINVAANSLSEISFSWNIPNLGGTYFVETNLIPSQLTAYDAAWLEAV